MGQESKQERAPKNNAPLPLTSETPKQPERPHYTQPPQEPEPWQQGKQRCEHSDACPHLEMQQTRIRHEKNCVPHSAGTCSAHFGAATLQPPVETTSTAVNKPTASQGQVNPAAGHGRQNAWPPLSPNTQAQHPPSSPKDVLSRKPLLTPPAENAGRQNQQAAKNGDRNVRAPTSSHTHHQQADTHNPPSALSGNPLAATLNKVPGRENALGTSPHHHCTSSSCSHWYVSSVSYLHTHTHVRSRVGEGERSPPPPQVGSDPPGTLSWACCGLWWRSSLGSSRGNLSVAGTNCACTWPASTCW